MSDSIVKPRRPGGVTAISIITMVISIYGIASGIILIVPMIVTGHPSGVISLIKFIDIPNFGEIANDIVEFYDGMFVIIVPPFIGYFIVSIIGLYSSRTLLKSKQNSLLFGKIYIMALSALMAGTLVWLIVSGIIIVNNINYNSGFSASSSRYFGQFNSIFQLAIIFSYSFYIILGTVYIIVISRIMLGSRHKAYFASLKS